MRWWFVLALAACEEVGEATYLPAPDWCDDAPVTTWDNFGRGFLVENCQGCHASASLDRHEAPLEFVFDTPEDVVTHRQAILDIAAGIFPRCHLREESLLKTAPVSRPGLPATSIPVCAEDPLPQTTLLGLGALDRLRFGRGG